MTVGPSYIENQNNSKSKGKLTRPKPCYLWSTNEVQRWLKRHCNEYYTNYSNLFLMVRFITIFHLI